MSPDATVTALIVDDEPVARAGLRRLLADAAWLRVVDEADNGAIAVARIDALRPDVVFLDVRMPGMSGIDVLRAITHRPTVVFTTAHAEHAIASYELGAIDYLLKPFGPERLAATLARVRSALGQSDAPAMTDRLAAALGERPLRRVFVRTGRAIVPVPVERIAWIEAVGDYVTLHVDGATHVMHVPLQRFEDRLDPATFVRIHRRHLVNLAHVDRFVRTADGVVTARLRDGTTALPVSRARAQALRSLIDAR